MPWYAYAMIGLIVLNALLTVITVGGATAAGTLAFNSLYVWGIVALAHGIC